uniref:CREG-like beta-barrel domain-containing protein n=2 Tax=Clastoptera arizonana TaxID=38151 RepID=A0A1B6EE55_9HEMI
MKVFGVLVVTIQLALSHAALDWLDAVIIDNYNAENIAEAQFQGNQISEVSLHEEPLPPPPDVKDAAKYARYIVHYSSWGSLSHISWQPFTTALPIARAYSISDGPIGKGNGVPYFLMTIRDNEMQDIVKDPRASLTCSLAQSNFCRDKAYDPEDPRCSQVILTGKFAFIPNNTAEWKIAENAMYSRHPIMKTWPKSHDWQFAKLFIRRILLVNYFGGNKYPSVESYFKADPVVYSEENPFNNVNFS